MEKEKFLAEIQAGNYEVRQESDCHCSFNWQIEGGQLLDGCDSDECWIAGVLYIGKGEAAEAVYQRVQFEGGENLADFDVEEALEEIEQEDILNECRIGDNEENDEHLAKRLESLVEWLKESGYGLYVDRERGFANEYTCVLVAEGAEFDDDDLDSIDAQDWAERFLYTGDPTTQPFVGFRFID